jgi:pimeloyl-ACP methyl ester carboxylesterase
MADELHRLVEAAGLPTPHVLVGWSYGGFISQLYATRHPHAVSGLVPAFSLLFPLSLFSFPIWVGKLIFFFISYRA